MVSDEIRYVFQFMSPLLSSHPTCDLASHLISICLRKSMCVARDSWPFSWCSIPNDQQRLWPPQHRSSLLQEPPVFESAQMRSVGGHMTTWCWVHSSDLTQQAGKSLLSYNL